MESWMTTYELRICFSIDYCNVVSSVVTVVNWMHKLLINVSVVVRKSGN